MTEPQKQKKQPKQKAPAKAIPLEQQLWNAAVVLRGSISPSDYKHVVLGLVFLKYLSDAFERQRASIAQNIANPSHDDYYEDPADHKEALELVVYYTRDNVFWVPDTARWSYIQQHAKQPNLGRILDDALLALENSNKALKGILNKLYSTTVKDSLGPLVDLVSTITFSSSDADKDIFGQVYEYFLGNFALTEGQGAGEFYTTSSIVNILVEVLSPHKGKIYDPCCGAGGMFVQSRKFVESHGGTKGAISIYGQEKNDTTWKLAAMNLAIRGIEFNLGSRSADTLKADQHPDQKFNYILSNPPYNIAKWGADQVQSDKRWTYGLPPDGNANFAWLQHILWHLAPDGQAGVVLANGSMSSTTSNEANIRQAMVDADTVEVMVSLPNNLFLNTAIPASLWFLCKDKRRNGRDRRRETLFIDARNLGHMQTRTLRVFSDQEIAKIANTVHRWRQDPDAPSDAEPYADEPGFCRSVKIEDIAAQGYVLTPGRYVGTPETDIVEEAFDDAMQQLTSELATHLSTGEQLLATLRTQLGGLGYAV